MVLVKSRQKLLSNFWFDERGRVIVNEYLNKWYLFWDALTRQRTDGALVRVEMILGSGQSVAEGQAIMDGFVGRIKEILPRYVPK